MDQPIGIIDSGIGGLTIAKALIKKLSHESVIYLADSKNCPYGDKSSKEIYSLTKKMVDFLLKKNIKLLVVACNTITVTSIGKLRKDYPDLPVVGIVPVIKTAVEETKAKRIGIFSTKATAKSSYQKELISKFAKGIRVINIGSSDLVPLIEELDFEAIESVLEKELAPFIGSQIDVLALGCSHFPLIEKQIKHVLPKALILDSSGAVGRQVERILIRNKLLSKSGRPSYNFYTTGNLDALSHFVDKLTNKAKLSRILLQ